MQSQFRHKQPTRFNAPEIDQDLATKVYIDDLTFNKVLRGKKVKQVDEVISNDDVAFNDAELAIGGLEANTRFAFMVQIFCQSDATADMKMGFGAPAGSVGRVLSGNFNGTVAQAVIGTAVTAKTFTNSLEKVMSMMGHILIGGTAGTLVFQWAQNTATVVDTTVFAGSSLFVWQQG